MKSLKATAIIIARAVAKKKIATKNITDMSFEIDTVIIRAKMSVAGALISILSIIWYEF